MSIVYIIRRAGRGKREHRTIRPGNWRSVDIPEMHDGTCSILWKRLTNTVTASIVGLGLKRIQTAVSGNVSLKRENEEKLCLHKKDAPQKDL